MLAIRFISQGFLFVVILVILLSHVELSYWQDLCHNRFLIPSRPLQLSFRFFCKHLLFIRMIKDGSAVLLPPVNELTTGICRIYLPPEDIKEPLVGYL